MTPERRREIFDRVVDRWAQRGFQFETSPIFRASVDDWIEGRISIQELKQRYSEFLRTEFHRGAGLTVTETEF
ncbi:hypothetical protein [Pseudorhizobium flavum]|jgi:hypothetical protein|uniref:hypothetical protein n=1 Tax=Pseudorhizobium flavum TaxID=1335061 RepID=UPI002490577F|nr:hypothetical protein [Pseudorhizobium flavum]